MRDGDESCSASVGSACRRGPAMCAIAAALAIAATAAAMQFSRRSLADVNRRADAVDREWTDAAARVQAAADLRQSQQSITRHAECAQAMLETTPRSAILAEVTNALPAGSWLASFTLDSAEADDAANITVIGFAPDDAAVGQYMVHLRQSNLLRDVKLSACNDAAQQGTNLRQFRVDMRIGGSDRSREPIAQRTLTASIGH
jgi:Tfp pilus assembly protein PilN